MRARPSIGVQPSDSRGSVAAVLASMVSINLGALGARSLFPVLGAAGTTALRLTLAALILCVVSRAWRFRADRDKLLATLPYGVSLGAMNLLYYMAIQRIPLGIALALEFTGPLTVAVLASRARREFGWVGLAVIGLALLLPFSRGENTIDPTGMVFALAAGVFWGAYIVTGKRAGRIWGQQAATVGMIIGAVVVLPFGLAPGLLAFTRPHILAIGLVVAVLSSVVPFSFEMFALRRISARTFSILISGDPAVAAILGMLVAGELLPISKWLGITAIAFASIGVALSQRSQADQKQPVPDQPI